MALARTMKLVAYNIAMDYSDFACGTKIYGRKSKM